MSDLKLDIACARYDRVNALFDGTVKIEGVDATFHSARIVTEIFERMIEGREFDVSELGMWTCVGSVDCFRLRTVTVRGKEISATNKPSLPTGVSP